MYSVLSEREHVLLRPDMYIGSIDVADVTNVPIFLHDNSRLVFETKRVSPALFQLFDEILQNSIDEASRFPEECKNIKIGYDPVTRIVSIENDGRGIPIEPFSETNKSYIPTVLFSEFRSGSNFNDNGTRVTAGKNGVGAKATNIFSDFFQVYVQCDGKTFTQEFRNNMSIIGKPSIKGAGSKKKTLDNTAAVPVLEEQEQEKKKKKKKGCVRISYHLDESKIPIPDWIEKYFHARAILTSAISKAKVFYQNVAIKEASSLQDIPRLISPSLTSRIFSKDFENGWGSACYGIADVSLGTNIIGFVNGLACSQGTHINHVLDAMAESMGSTVKVLKQCENFFCILSVTIPEPKFTSQTKDKLATLARTFPKISIPDAHAKAMKKADAIKELEQEQEDREKRKMLAAAQVSSSKALLETSAATTMSSSSSSSSSSSFFIPRRRVQVPKLTDAPLAGTADPRTTLILCEGDSAMGAVKSGLLKEQRDYYGIFPLRGKIPNALKKDSKSFLANKEIQYMVDALGLKFDAPGSLTSLRYKNGIILATDQDADGHHICSLVYSFFWMYFRPLLQARPDFIKRMNTPLIKVLVQGTEERLEFLNKDQFQEWKKTTTRSSGYTVKYFKGLGTNEIKDMTGYFRNIQKYLVPLHYNGEASDDMIKKMFGENVADRRDLLIKRNQNVDLHLNPRSIEYYMFKETGSYFLGDIVRSLPCVVDGLKPALRKIVHAVLKRSNNISLHKKSYKDNGMKVSEFASAVAQSTMYHHGEVSMQETVIGMAQCILGVNNIPLLHGIGNFGTRESKPSESHASPRYIFVNHQEFIECMFPPQESILLPRVEEDGELAECVYFTPTLPYILVNGSEGIGTGWSSEILPRNFKDLVSIQKNLIQKQGRLEEVDNFDLVSNTIHYEFFRGHVKPGTYETQGKANIIWHSSSSSSSLTSMAEIKIEELPVGVWTSEFLDTLKVKFDMKKERDTNVKEKRFIIDLYDRSSAYQIDISIVCDAQILKDLYGLSEDMVDLPESFLKILGLVSKFSATNCNALYPDNREQWIYNFVNVKDIFKAHMEFKLPILEKRLNIQKNVYEHELNMKQQQVLFLELVLSGRLQLIRRPRLDIEKELQDIYKFPKMAKMSFEDFAIQEKEKEKEKSYDYLLKLQFLSCTREHIEDLEKEISDLRRELQLWNLKTAWILWSEDLDRLEEAYNSFMSKELKEREREDREEFKSPQVKRPRKK